MAEGIIIENPRCLGWPPVTRTGDSALRIKDLGKAATETATLLPFQPLFEHWESVAMSAKRPATGDEKGLKFVGNPEALRPTLKQLGGSQLDHWNNTRANQAVQALWVKNSDTCRGAEGRLVDGDWPVLLRGPSRSCPAYRVTRT